MESEQKLIGANEVLTSLSIPKLEIIYQWYDEYHKYFYLMPDGELACIARMNYTWKIIYGLNLLGLKDGWCYRTQPEAVAALDEWARNFDTMTEPSGWCRHPGTGRRVYDTWCEVRL